MSPPFSLRPLPPSDAPSVARIFQAAFANEHIMRHFYPRTPEEAKWEMDVRFFEGLLRKCDGGEIGSEGGSGEYGIYGGGWLAFLRMVVREMDMGMGMSTCLRCLPFLYFTIYPPCTNVQTNIDPPSGFFVQKTCSLLKVGLSAHAYGEAEGEEEEEADGG